MDTPEINKFKRTKDIAFAIVLDLFLVVFTVLMLVDIQNRVKQGKYIGQDIESRNTITVSDTGEIYAKPDLAITTFSVLTEAKTVARALGENTAKMNKVIDSMKAEGIKTADLKTTNFSIYPRYDWLKETACDLYPCPPEGKRVLMGYEITQSLKVKIRDMEKIGDIIQKATDTGANEVGNLQFTIDNEDNLKKQARGQAIKKAREKARELASQLGVNLVKITNFNESFSTPRFYEYGYAMEKAMGEAAPEAPQIETGENKISVSVTITYEIN